VTPPLLTWEAVKFSIITPARPSPESPLTKLLVREVETMVHGLWPEVIVLPEMSPGASDSSYTRAFGMPSYGIDAMFDDLDDGRAHGRDERIGVQAFDQDVEFTYRSMKVLAGS
jgi:acetylornithine deacetylase/succinyl-diaminopimelate desuccinylase-like protein